MGLICDFSPLVVRSFLSSEKLVITTISYYYNTNECLTPVIKLLKTKRYKISAAPFLLPKR